MRGSCLFLLLAYLLPLLNEVRADNVDFWGEVARHIKNRDKEAFDGSGDVDTLDDDSNWWNEDDEDSDSLESSGEAEPQSSVALVIPVEASVKFDLPTKLINLGALNCRLKDGTRVTCVQVSARLRYSGISVTNRIGVKLEYNLDAKKQNRKRMFLLGDEGKSSQTRTIYLQKYVEWKESFMVYIPESPHDKLTSLDIWMNFNLDNSSRSFSIYSLPQVLDDHLETDSLSIQKDCGADNLCIPDLSVSTQR